MTEKLSLEQFLLFKKKLSNIVAKKYKLDIDDHAGLIDNYLEQAKSILDEYNKVKDVVFKYDLSDIPANSWFGFPLLADEDNIIDLSKTHANIDFSVRLYSPYINYKSCNITNFDRAKGVLNADYFDEDIVKAHPESFILSSLDKTFTDKMMNKSLTFDDYMSLSDETKKTLDNKNLIDSFNASTISLVKAVGLDKLEEIYNNSKEDYDVIYQVSVLLGYDRNYIISDPFTRETFDKELKEASALDIKNIYYKYLINSIFENNLRIRSIKIDELPKKFIEENKDTFLINDNFTEEFRQRFYHGQLTYEDIMDNISLFKEIPFESITHDRRIRSFVDIVGEEKAHLFIENSPRFMKYILEGNLGGEYGNFLIYSEEPFEVKPDEDFEKKLIEYSQSFFYTHKQLENKEQFKNYSPDFFELHDRHKSVVTILGLDNMKRFDKETGFFSFQNKSGLAILNQVSMFFVNNNIRTLKMNKDIDFDFGRLPYEEFRNEFAKVIRVMRELNYFNDFNYDFIQGKFRDEHPEIFIDYDLPDPIKKAFYSNKIDMQYLFNFRDYLDSFVDKDLTMLINTKSTVKMPSLTMEGDLKTTYYEPFILMYVNEYGNEKLIELIKQYGPLLDDITIYITAEEFKNEDILNNAIRQAIYNKIIDKRVDYKFLLKNELFVQEHPDIFIDLSDVEELNDDAKNYLTVRFYNKELTFDDIRNNPILVEKLKDKNLKAVFKFRNNGFSLIHDERDLASKIDDLSIINVIGNEQFLEMCSKYGDYLKDIPTKIFRKGDTQIYHMDREEIDKEIQSLIIKDCINGNKSYGPDTTPAFLKERAPELFLDEDAPYELCKYFYTSNSDYRISFDILKQHKDWIPYLKDKSISTPFIHDSNHRLQTIQYFDLFGNDAALKLGITRTEVVEKMIRSHKVDVMKKWYDKTGGKFIPDYVVMLTFNENDIDKFLTCAPNWSKLMKIKSFAQSEETREAMLKLAYSFGAFDNDNRGFKKTLDLLTNVPRTIPADNSYLLSQLDSAIEFGTEKNELFSNTAFDKDEAIERYIDKIKYVAFVNPVSYEKVVDLIEAMKQEMPDFDYTGKIFEQLYKQNEDGSYSLGFYSQSNPKTSLALRVILENFVELNLVSPQKAHQLFGGFDMKYDPYFREFLLNNLEELSNDPEKATYLASIQKQFDDIRKTNSNRVLTLDLAISYVQENKFTGIEIGNEKVAEVSSIAGYTQDEFETLQKIYNYGKQRVYSSIPRVENTAEMQSGKYTYEILRLDDPLAMAIGTLSDCCQQIHDCAEMCMEHSMVDKNGRIFVVRDEEGHIVAQSWVWRNKDVICFDNIEIPAKAFNRALDVDVVTRNSFTTDVYNVYKKAAHDLIEEDEKVYKELLEAKKITKEQYDGLRLGKVTVGLGFNDIADAIHKNSELDRSERSHPLPFEPPVPLNRHLYTNDSTTQHIIEEREDRKTYHGETIPVHSDSFVEYTDENIKESDLLRLEKLEILTKDNPFRLNTDIRSYGSKENYVSDLAYNYDLNPDTTRVIIHPNFAIIYDTNGNKVTLGDLLFNTVVKNNADEEASIEDKVVMQIRLALDQIANNKEIDTSRLNPKQITMYNKATMLNEEIDIERGVGHAR